MKSIPDEVEKNVKIAIKASDFQSVIASKLLTELNSPDNIKEIDALAKAAIEEVSSWMYSSHKEIYESSGVEDKRKKLRNESKHFSIKDNSYPSTNSMFLSTLHDKLEEDVKRLENEYSTLQK
ncbi:Peptidase A25, germination protease family-containing protein [Strongyloides ratti]|uniref:Peptidase A25, germination protease family-containing protein n=1 Tax=Strongyloides ratti TaxID=34506 RepID=A0A090LIL1_STRRB|nr:Peptidase A25, germination protease family-containing protein [Strongyloides ratti]CEF67325.1 Peptidase A25, germination protease family-containing protein [Strongyloides ratti]